MNQNQEFNGFDEMGGVQDPLELALAKAQREEMWNKVDQLIHAVFDQNPQGKELLGIWTDALIMTPTVTANATQFQVGIEEGKKEMIRNICLTIKNVEGK